MSRTEFEAHLAEHLAEHPAERRKLIAEVIAESRRSSTRTVVFHAAIAERLGLNPSDHKCADLIMNETGPVTAGRLAELTGLSTGAITGVIDRLERAGFVARAPDPQDRRRVVIVSCPERRAPAFRNLFAPMVEGMIALCADYTDEELALVLDFMRQATAMTDERIHALRDANILGEPAQAGSGEAKAAAESAENTADSRAER